MIFGMLTIFIFMIFLCKKNIIDPHIINYGIFLIGIYGERFYFWCTEFILKNEVNIQAFIFVTCIYFLLIYYDTSKRNM